METENTHELNESELISKFKDQTPIIILIKDLEITSNLAKSDFEKNLILETVEVLKEGYVERERNVMTKFAFDFYSDLSRSVGVDENLISENLTHAEIYFDEKFNRK